MSFDKEFEDIAKQEVSGGSYISTPGIYKVEISENGKLSNDIEKKDFKGCPYLEIKFKSEDGLMNTTKFFRKRDTDSEEVVGYKQEAMNKFFTNAGVNLKESGMKALVEIKGKFINVLFRNEEYLGYDKNNNNMPVVKSGIKYLYSGPGDQELQGDSKYLHKALVPKDQAKFEAELKKWKRDNDVKEETPSAESAPEAKTEEKKDDSKVDEKDDLPF
jgi:hypothetical protein